MRLLHISPYVPSMKASHAGGVCMGKEVETLMKYNDVRILTFVNNDKEKKLLEEYDNNKVDYVKTSVLSHVLNGVFHIDKPLLFGIRGSIRFGIKLYKIIKKYDIEAIHCEYTSMAQYVWIKRFFPKLQFNIVEHDVTIQSYQRMYERSEGIKKIFLKNQNKKVYNCEKKYCSLADNIFVLNEKDKRLISEIYGINDVIVLNPYYGVTVEEYKKCDKKANSICFVGQMGRDENHSAAMRLIRIFNQINDENLSLTIIGAHPKEELLKHESKNIHITGFVDDIEKEIKNHEIAVFPLLYGAGIKLKVLLAFGLGVPVITTSIGAEGIDEKGEVLILAESDNEFKKEIVSLINDKEKLEELSKISADFVYKKFGWHLSEKILKKVYK